MKKIQFCIRFDDIDRNSAASKAVLDCNAIFSELGYEDFTITVPDNRNKKKYYRRLVAELSRFLFNVQSDSLIAIQYPLLSINQPFRWLMSAARLRKARFFCIVHDLESLRTGGKDGQAIAREIHLLNQYDLLIVHNVAMQQWLRAAGVNRPMIDLGLFDYLTDTAEAAGSPEGAVVYAGNLAKSTFIHDLPKTGARFTLYGPGYTGRTDHHTNVHWGGEFPPDAIPGKLEGGYGLVWDGGQIDRIEGPLGAYLKYNNPHKLSLYIAAGLPVIVPAGAAVASLVKRLDIGWAVESLYELKQLEPEGEEYLRRQANVRKLRKKIISGGFFRQAVKQAESLLTTHRR